MSELLGALEWLRQEHNMLVDMASQLLGKLRSVLMEVGLRRLVVIWALSLRM
jgi:hypothetical protein